MTMTTSRLFRAALVVILCVAPPAAGQAQKGPPVLKRPTPGPLKPFVYPTITTQTLPNGLRLAVIENHELPLVTVRVGLSAGVSIDPPGKEGAWWTLMSSLRQGTSTRSFTQITEEIADLGSTFTFPGIPPYNPPYFTAAKSAWLPSLQLLADLLTDPALSADGLQRARDAVANLMGRLTTGETARRLLYAHLYSPTHRYAQEPTVASVRAITRDDVVAVRKAYLGPQNALIVVAGDVTPAEARVAVMKAFGSWERSGTTIEAYTEPLAPRTTPTTIYLRDVPAAPTSLVLTGIVLPGRTAPDGIAAEALVSFLGGPSAGSRMYTAFRTERGLSYAPNVSLLVRPVPEPSMLTAAATVPIPMTDTAVTELVRVLREARGARPITTTELEFVRGALVGVLPLQLETNESLAARALVILQGRLPATFLNEQIRRLNALTLPEVQAAAAKYLDADHLAIVVMGDRSKIEAPLRATGIPVVIVP
jgi:zinc protease